MRAERLQNLVLIGLLLILGIGMGVAYWFGGDKSTAGASGPVAPVKKFRADPGTERENARALVSSVPSVKEETTDRPIEIWGSLDDDEPERDAFAATPESVAGLSHENAQRVLADRLAADDLSAEERAQTEAALGLALLLGEPREAEGARAAFERAFAACADADSRVQLAFVYAERLNAEDEYEETLELLKDGRFVGAKLSPTRLKLEALRGWALDALGRNDQARTAYSKAFESALASDLNESAGGRDAARLVALRLARHYRADGRERDATAVSRMLRAWLGEDDLVLR